MTKRILIKGVPFDQTTRAEAVKIIQNFLRQNQQFLVTTPNPEFLVEAEKNPTFKKILQKSALSVADGIGILWASTYLHQKKTPFALWWTLLQTLFFPQKIRQILPERVCGSDLFLDLCRESNAKIFLLGAREGVAQKTAEILKTKFPQIQIVGISADDPSVSAENKIITHINQSQAELLFVAYGSPKQELWLERNLAKLKTVKVALGIGGSFDFVAGTQKRAPRFLRQIGLEWLYRLIREPKRFRRIWNATFVFVKMITRD